jgi:signal transduction histidine kinase
MNGPDAVAQVPRLLRTQPFQLSAIYISLFSVAVALTTLYIYWNTRVLLARELDNSVQAEVAVLLENYRRGGVDGLAAAVAERSNPAGNSLYLLTDGGGIRLAGNMNVVSTALWNTVGRTEFTYRRIGAHGQEERKAYASVIRLPGGERLLVGRDVEDRSALEGVIRSAFFLGLGFIAIVGIGGGLLVSRSILARIDAVTRAARSIMGGNLSDRIPVSGRADEFDRLSSSLNTMLDRIEELMVGLKQVSDNIAHDLKTPLHRLRTRAETALRGETSPEKLRETLSAIIEESDGLIHTFDALLSIARLEAGSRSETFGRFNLCEVVRDVCELYEPLAEEQGLRFRIDCLPDVRIDGERQLVGQAVANLLDNAIKYAAADGDVETAHPHDLNGARPRLTPAERQTITVAVAERPDFAEVIVADRGPGVAPADRERVLQRFTRLQPSRSVAGSGLGLSLVAAVARLHAGAVVLEDNEPGLRVRLHLRKQAESGQPGEVQASSVA